VAVSPAHRWGQIIGNLLEDAVAPLLEQFAQQHGLYLDRKGPRPVRKTLDVIWADARGNKHKLDYVIERDGSATSIGVPVAFIEIAWRRYTKHSKNKAQEIEAAIQPLLTKHQEVAPFFGVVLGGVFTSAALEQLRTVGCVVAYFPYETILKAFAHANIDASSEEDTPDSEFTAKVRAWEALKADQRQDIAQSLVAVNDAQMRVFMESLRLIATRQIVEIQVLPLHGSMAEFSTVGDALSFLGGYDTTAQAQPLVKYEIQLRYNNGNRITAEFTDTLSADQFLRGYLPPAIHPIQEEKESS